MVQPIVVSISPQSAFVVSGQTVQFTVTVRGSSSGVTWLVNGIAGGNSTTGTIDASGNYTAPTVTQNAMAVVTATSKREPSRLAVASVSIIAPGRVSSTKNPQVAIYTIMPPADAQVAIQFGTDTNYGLATWSQATPPGGGPVSIYVAGMRANATYHMRAVVQFSGNGTVNDNDHTFATASLPSASLPNLTTTATPGTIPQSGLELLDLIGSLPSQVDVAVTDLLGNLVWGHVPAAGYGAADPVKLLPNGHFLLNLSGQPDGTGSILQEVDLAWNVVWQMTAAQLNQALAAATCVGCNTTVVGTHHDFAILPNGHIIVIAAEQQLENGLMGYSGPVTVTGDVLIDLDPTRKPVWVWSAFDHLDLNRHPMAFPDWTHTNTVVYSPDDKALIVSMRHQHWVIKIDYNDGQGTGNILWKLGYQGDFTLQKGVDPVDWFYAQHDPNILSSNGSGVFEILLFDNGDYRVLDSSGDICPSTVTPCASRVPILQLDESARTATIEWVDDLTPVYSSWGGSARLLANGNVEFAECVATPTDGAIFEVTRTSPPQTIWQMRALGQAVYRGFRIPSLYPGVQW